MILIGCPVYNRAWILPLWFDRIKKQTIPLSELGFVFVVSSKDKDTLEALFRFQSENPEIALFDVVFEDGVTHQSHRETDEDDPILFYRKWENVTAYERMVRLRNSLLTRVREIAPEMFFSLDSDILIDDPETIEKLAEHIRVAGDIAVSPLCYMSANTMYQSFMMWKHTTESGIKIATRPRAYPPDEVFGVDVIMAAKMMSPKAYNVDYNYHRLGEDVGWSYNCLRHGVDLYFDGSIYASHILSRKMLDLYLAFGDYRAPSCQDMAVSKL